MPEAKRGDPMRTAEKAFVKTLRGHESDERVRLAAEHDAQTEAKIARLRELRLAKEAEEGRD